MYPHRIRFSILISTLLMLLSAISVTQAQTQISPYWMVEERCIAAPMSATAGWTYSGMILMSGYAGIHAIESDWTTPHIVAFFRDDETGYPINGGQLSPDGRWYAVPVGEVFTEISFNKYWFVNGINLYSTANPEVVTRYNLQDYVDLADYFPVAWGYLPIEWKNNTSFVFGDSLFDTGADTLETVPFNLAGSMLYDRFIAPDLSRTIGQLIFYRNDPEALSTLIPAVEGIARLEGFQGASWKPDSSGFIASTDTEEGSKLILYDRDGNLQETIFNLGTAEVDFGRSASGRNDSFWSRHGNQFAFVAEIGYAARFHTLYIVDMKRQIVTDTCLHPISRPVWSPDGKMLAYLAEAEENLKVVVVDLSAWTAYDVARHSGLYTNRAFPDYNPDMIGWRELD